METWLAATLAVLLSSPCLEIWETHNLLLARSYVPFKKVSGHSALPLYLDLPSLLDNIAFILQSPRKCGQRMCKSEKGASVFARMNMCVLTGRRLGSNGSCWGGRDSPCEMQCWPCLQTDSSEASSPQLHPPVQDHCGDPHGSTEIQQVTWSDVCEMVICKVARNHSCQINVEE